MLFERTEYSQVFAQPDGSFELTQSTTPQRVRASDGTWKPVDVTLAKRADGRIAPKGAVVDLSFSGKGTSSDMIRIGDGDGHALSLGWDRSLPEPVLEGDTATYREVLPGVDLRLTATAESYREVLVVKTPQAAASPALDKVLFHVESQGLEVRSTTNGGLVAANDDGVEVFTGPPGRMWDSAGDAQAPGEQPMRDAHTPHDAQTSATAVRGAEEPDPATGPGDGDASAVMPVQVAEDTIAVVPDTEVLEGDETVYPVYIDPAVGIGHTYRTVLSSDGDDYWMFDGAGHGIGRCGYNSQGACTAGTWYTNRMYFQFNSASALRGKYVIDATFRAYETWSFDCNPAWVDLERTDGISSGSKWPGPGGPKSDNSWDQLGDRYISAGRGTACSPEQPNAWIEFNDNPDEPDENLKSTVRNFADGKIDNLTLMLKAKDESDVTAWKRFDDNAELQVDFAYQPGVPTRYGLWPGNPGGDPDDVQCATSSSNPVIVTRAEPFVQAAVQTKVEHHAGDSEGLLQAEWVMEQRRSDGTWGSSWSGYQPPKGSWGHDGDVETIKVSERTDKTLYRVKVRTQSHWTYGSKSGDLFSSYTPWCYFKVDADRPQPPVVTAVPDGIYNLCVTEDCPGQGGPGIKGTLHFAQNAADTDVVKYEWRLPGMAKTDFATGADVDEQITPLVAGRQTLQVRGWDSGGSGEWAYIKLKVTAGQGALGRWRFDDHPAGSQEKLARDTAVEGSLRHNATMYTDGTGFSSLARRGDADQSLWLDSTDPAEQQGYAATSTAPINTSDSFTVSTWAYLSDASTNRMLLAQPGSSANVFSLYYSTTYNAWVFNRTDQDKSSPVYIRSVAEEKPQLKVWTHVAGVFKTEGDDGLPDSDPTNDTIQLFVNGRPQGEPVNLASVASTYQPWSATGGLQWGRSVKAGAGGEFFRGRLDETAVWQRPLTEPEVRLEGELKENELAATELMADWDAATSTGSTLVQASGYPVAGMGLVGGATLAETPQVLALNGTTGYASSSGPAVDETGSFTVSALARVDSAQLVGKANGYTVTVAKQKIGNESSWALKLVKLADDVNGDGKPEGVWRFERTRVDGAGKKVSTTHVSATSAAVLDEMVHITGVYDASEPFTDGDATLFGKLHLFVGADEQADESTEPDFADPQQGTGELAIGRGHTNGTPGQYLPGAVQQLRVWTGAMESRQISERVLGEPVS
ncbi:LamG-like jellyroll fold domain-containing protein [Streptomyces sp. NPDC008343]|uniref:LamG-like jellyroll fold domain-containing protein n=1 Tax=Streptomyces sp. NPDC008343 TaxID=3364828 RepID=UPI0036EFE8DF